MATQIAATAITNRNQKGKTMTISKRLMLLAGIAVLALLVVSGLGLTQLQRVYEAANYGNENTVPSIKTLAKARYQFMALRIRVYRHVLNTDPKAIAELDASITDARKNIDQAMAEYEKLVSSDEDRRMLEEEKKGLANYLSHLENIFELGKQNRQDEALKALNANATQARALAKVFDEHIHFNETLGTKAASEAAEAIKTATWTVIGVSLLAILISGGLTFQIRSSLLARLAEANRLAGGIASGDLSTRNTPPQISEDEIGKLIQAMENMRRDLATTVSAIAANSDQLATSAAQLSTTAQQVSSASQSQSSSTSASAAAVEELTVSIDHVGSSADEATSQAAEAGNLASERGRNVQAAAQQINLVANRVGDTAQQIETLSAHVKQIGNITTVIRDVADQTILLALNAAIEAARAGEQGRGFAVVADEVRKLAERTSQATGEISSMISAIQGETQSAIVSIEAGTGQAKNGAELAQQAADSLERINRGARDTMEKVEAIASAIDEQSRSGADIADHVRNIMSMAEANSLASEKALGEAGQLEYLATNLKEIGNVFKLGSAGEQAVQTHAKMPPIVQRAAADIGAILEKAVDSGRIRLEDLFDQSYQPIANTKPQK